MLTDTTHREALAAFLGDSRVVHPDGTPQVVYHGSRSPWVEQFDLGLIGTGIVQSGAARLGGLWFTSSRENAEFFANTYSAGPARLTQESILLYGEAPRCYALLHDGRARPLFSVGPHTTPDDAATQALRQGALYNARRRQQNPFVLHAYLRIQRPLLLSGVVPRDEAFLLARSRRCDGIIAREVLDGSTWSDVFVVFRPEQVKSALDNVGTYRSDTPQLRD